MIYSKKIKKRLDELDYRLSVLEMYKFFCTNSPKYKVNDSVRIKSNGEKVIVLDISIMSDEPEVFQYVVMKENNDKSIFSEYDLLPEKN